MFSKIRIPHIVLLAFLLRILFFLIYKPWNGIIEKTLVLNGDAPLYHSLANCILQHFSFCNNELRSPGYPFFLAFFYFIVGVKPWFILLIQILLNVYCCYLLYEITKKIFSAKSAIFAALIIAIDPHQILICHYLFPDILFATLFLLTLKYYINGLYTQKRINFFIVGVLLGLNILIKPVLQYFPFALILFLLIWCNFNWKEKLINATIILCLSILIITPWMCRNYLMFNNYKLTSVSGFVMFFNNVPILEASLTHKNIDSIINQNLKELKQSNPQAYNLPNISSEMWKNPSFENEKYYSDFSKKYLSVHKMQIFKKTISGMFRMMINMGTQNFLERLHVPIQNKWNYNQRYSLSFLEQTKLFVSSKSGTELFLGFFILFYFAVCYLFYFVGVVICLRQRKLIALLFIGCMFYFLLIYGILPVVRYKLPITMMYAPICGLGISTIINYFSTKKKILNT
jgi:4-amino-4-deoxy-L-arabinose transferase-like glycosyltransferase